MNFVRNLYFILFTTIQDGYGFFHIPTVHGEHEIEVLTWRPKGTFLEELRSNTVNSVLVLKFPLGRFFFRGLSTVTE
jgi:hypothetical protein